MGLFKKIFSREKKETLDKGLEKTKQGVFEKVSKGQKNKKIDKSYIEDFAKTIYIISPPENRINLDISKLYE